MNKGITKNYSGDHHGEMEGQWAHLPVSSRNEGRDGAQRSVED